MCIRERERERERKKKREKEREMCARKMGTKIWCVCAFVSEWMRESV